MTEIPMKKKNPEVRFKGFTEDWKQVELGQVLEERKTLQKISEDAPILAFASGQGVIDRSERKSNNRDHLTLDQENKIYKLTELNDIVYNPSNLKYGAIDRNKHGRGVISPIYVTFTTEEEPSFIELIVKSEKFKLRALQYEEGTVVKRQSVSPENLLSLKVGISNSLDEQKKIGIFFDYIEDLIRHHQEKYSKLTVLKKAMLDKMFPKNGAVVPEVRFKGFVEDWMQKPLNKITTYHSSSLSVGDAKSQGKFKLYDANKVIGFTNENEIRSEYITIIKDGSGVGRVRKMPENTSFIGTLGAICSIDVDIDFLFCLLVKTDFRRHITGATIPHIYYSNYGNELYLVPNEDEQIKIGGYFRNFDNQISLHENQLKKLVDIKKACFSKLLVTQD